MIHLGIDLHSRNMTLVALNDNGKLIREVKAQSNAIELEGFFQHFDQPRQAAVECTSYWYWVADWCKQHNMPLQLAHAKMLKAISYAKVKTDSIDARTLADLLRAGLIPQAHMAEGSQRDLRELTRARLRMSDRRRKLQGSLWQLAAKYNLLVGDVGWRYLDRLEEFLTDGLPEVVHWEAAVTDRANPDISGSHYCFGKSD